MEFRTGEQLIRQGNAEGNRPQERTARKCIDQANKSSANFSGLHSEELKTSEDVLSMMQILQQNDGNISRS